MPCDEQLEFVDSVSTDRPEHDLQRLGETREFGALLLDLLEASGMEVARYQAFAGGVGVTVKIGPVELRASGACLADFACDLFMEAMELRSFLKAAT